MRGTGNYYDPYFHAGETVNIVSQQCPGHLTGSAKTIEFTIALWKLIPSNLTATVSGNVTIRHVGGGYLASNVSIASLGSISTKASNNLLKVEIDASTAFSATNNTPVCVQIPAAGLTITFN